MPWNRVNIGFSNGWWADGPKPLAEPMLTQHQRGVVAFTRDPFHRKYSKISSVTQMSFNIVYLSLMPPRGQWVNTLRPRHNGRHFADDIFKCILLNENVWITINNSLKFVPSGPINNIAALFQIMAWRRPGDKPLSEPMMVSLTMHICVNRPQWVNCWYFVMILFENSQWTLHSLFMSMA